MTDNPRSPWQQLTYTCDDWRAAENTAVAVLGPLLTTAQDKGDIASWWFIRKGPEWRVRLESPAGQPHRPPRRGPRRERGRPRGHRRHLRTRDHAVRRP